MFIGCSGLYYSFIELVQLETWGPSPCLNSFSTQAWNEVCSNFNDLSINLYTRAFMCIVPLQIFNSYEESAWRLNLLVWWAKLIRKIFIRNSRNKEAYNSVKFKWLIQKINNRVDAFIIIYLWMHNEHCLIHVSGHSQSDFHAFF